MAGVRQVFARSVTGGCTGIKRIPFGIDDIDADPRDDEPVSSRTPTLRLGIDLDGVVADFSAGWIARFNRDHGTSLTVEDVTEWDAPMLLTGFADIDEFWSWFATAGDTGGSIFADLDPYPGALEALHWLAGHGHELVVLSTKPDFAVHETYRWLAHHGFPSREIHLLDDKANVECDVYLDDADHNLEALTQRRPDALVCRYVRPWNRPWQRAVDVHGWRDFEQVVDSTPRR